MNKSRAMITDARDDRERARGEDAVTVDLSQATTRSTWSVEGTGLGFRFLWNVGVTRLNLGVPIGGGPQIDLGGKTRTVGGFLLCRACGHVDMRTGTNEPSEHQGWCDLRKAADGDTVRVALSRTIHTEAVIVSLPESIREDGSQTELWSFIAALRLGISRQYGGSISNLHVEDTIEPGHPERRALLLSDTVPGGTGYLAELSEPRAVRRILLRALVALSTCRCREDGLPACHQCLLTYVPTAQREHLSRVRVQAMLVELLGLADDAPGTVEAALAETDTGDWEISEAAADPTADFESPLERAFRHRIREEFARRPGYDVSQRSTDSGIPELSIRHDGRTFRLRPQVDVLGCRPDFMLEWHSNDEVQQAAIFLDGKAFHAGSGDKNKAADDAEKRARLREADFLVYSVTHEDLEEFGRRRDGTSTAKAPELVDPNIVGAAAAAANNGQFSDAAKELIFSTPVEQIIALVENNGPREHLRAGAQLPIFLFNAASQQPVDRGNLAGAARRALANGRADGHDDAEGTVPGVARRRGRLGLALTTRQPLALALVLDDSPEAVADPDFLDAWQTWLHLANLAQDPRSEDHLVVTTTTLLGGAVAAAGPGHLNAVAGSGATAGVAGVAAGADGPANPYGRQDLAAAPEDPSSGRPLTITAEWREALDDVETTLERDVLQAAAQAGLPVPEVGEEYEGVILDLAWEPEKVAYVVDHIDEESRGELVQDGWTIFEADANGLIAAVAEAHA